MALTDLQRKQLITQINTLPMRTIIPYFENGEVTLEEVSQILPERKEEIIKILNSRPNPDEQRDWVAIEPHLIGVANTNINAYVEKRNTSDLESIVGMLNVYISKWEMKLPAGNHVEEAKLQRNSLEETIRKVRELIEEEDWKTVNKYSKGDLQAYITKYPQSVHILEIDDIIWNMAVANNSNVTIYDIQEYMTTFPNGSHYAEAGRLYSAIGEWDRIKNSSDVFEINNYLRNNHGSPFELQARSRFMTLKGQELDAMRTRPNEYSRERLIRVIKEGVFSENELINERVTTPNILSFIKIPDSLPDIEPVIQSLSDKYKSEPPQCADGHTDVYLFGIPSTGKTCVLMGLSHANSLKFNFATISGNYAMTLDQYTSAGATPPGTPQQFATALESTISSYVKDTPVEHKINIVEMSGEEFAAKIADNPDQVFDFESMGEGAVELLKNDNRKVFFLIIDPTMRMVRSYREVVVGYDPNGVPIRELRYVVVNQHLVMQKMVDILQDPANKEIMKRVDAIHIVMTKADTLGAPNERDDIAYDIFQRDYASRILDPLCKLCKEYNINHNIKNKFRPRLYTFSLGKFYAGNLFEYDPTDSDNLVEVIRLSTRGFKEKTWWERFKEIVN